MQLSHVRTAIAGAVAAALLLAAPLQATVTVPTDLSDVVSLATTIVRGRVIEARAFADIANGPVTTAVTVNVSEVLKGSSTGTLTFRAHGGELGRYRQVIVGAPVFAVGDDAYLFLKRASDGALWTVGLGAGVYKVSAATGRAVVMPPVVADVTATSGAPVVRGDSRRKPMGVGDFAGIVKLLLAAKTGAVGATSVRGGKQ